MQEPALVSAWMHYMLHGERSELREKYGLAKGNDVRDPSLARFTKLSL